MSEVLRTRYVLAVNNLKSSSQYYIEKLGFKVLNEYEGWSFLGRGVFIVMLGECKDAQPPIEIGDHSYFAYVDVADVSSLYAEYKNANVEFIKELASEPWGMKEFGIRTIDGHRIMFGEEIII